MAQLVVLNDRYAFDVLVSFFVCVALAVLVDMLGDLLPCNKKIIASAGVGMLSLYFLRYALRYSGRTPINGLYSGLKSLFFNEENEGAKAPWLLDSEDKGTRPW